MRRRRVREGGLQVLLCGELRQGLRRYRFFHMYFMRLGRPIHKPCIWQLEMLQVRCGISHVWGYVERPRSMARLTRNTYHVDVKREGYESGSTTFSTLICFHPVVSPRSNPPPSFSFPSPPIPFQAQRRREPRVPNAPLESLVPVIAHRPRAVMVPLPRPTAPRVQRVDISTSSRGPGQPKNVASVRQEVTRTTARAS